MQLFTHLLSSYLQGMGDFFSALPRGRSISKPHHKPHPGLPQGEGAAPYTLKHSKKELPPLGEGLGRGFHKQLFLYRRKPDFLNGRRPLFLPSRRMASCTA